LHTCQPRQQIQGTRDRLRRGSCVQKSSLQSSGNGVIGKSSKGKGCCWKPWLACKQTKQLACCRTCFVVLLRKSKTPSKPIEILLAEVSKTSSPPPDSFLLKTLALRLQIDQRSMSSFLNLRLSLQISRETVEPSQFRHSTKKQ
jgi:hypothetical protein